MSDRFFIRCQVFLMKILVSRIEKGIRNEIIEQTVSRVYQHIFAYSKINSLQKSFVEQ